MKRDMTKKIKCTICGKMFQSLGYSSHRAMHRREREKELNRNALQHCADNLTLELLDNFARENPWDALAFCADNLTDEPKKILRGENKMADEEPKKILKLTLMKKWFVLMELGVKKIEFRQPSDWIYSRLLDENGDEKKYDLIEFRNGYRKNAPSFCCEFLGWDIEEKQTEYIFGSVKIITDVGTIKIFLGKVL